MLHNGKDLHYFLDTKWKYWGNGEWMRDWVQRMNAAGAQVIGNEGIIAHEAPGDEEISLCKESGKTLAGYKNEL